MRSQRAQQPSAMSPRSLVKAIGIALFAALALLVTVILPAEYGIDPLGTGAALGVSGLSPRVALAPVPPPAGDTLAPVQAGAIALYPGAFSYDAREFILGPYEYLEYKYHLAGGAAMFFSWSASADVLHDFHGDRDGAAANAAVSFDSQPRRTADGSFLAPFAGIHGWYWENPGGSSISIRLTTAGFYTAAHEFHFDGTRIEREVRGLDGIPVQSH